MRFGRWVSHLNFQGYEQVELLLRFVIPEFGRSNGCSTLNKSNVFVISAIGNNDTSLQTQDAPLLVFLEAVVMPQLIGPRGRHILGSSIQSLVAFLGQSGLAGFRILLHLRPQRFVGG